MCLQVREAGAERWRVFTPSHDHSSGTESGESDAAGQRKQRRRESQRKGSLWLMHKLSSEEFYWFTTRDWQRCLDSLLCPEGSAAVGYFALIPKRKSTNPGWISHTSTLSQRQISFCLLHHSGAKIQYVYDEAPSSTGLFSFTLFSSKTHHYRCNELILFRFGPALIFKGKVYCFGFYIHSLMYSHIHSGFGSLVSRTNSLYISHRGSHALVSSVYHLVMAALQRPLKEREHSSFGIFPLSYNFIKSNKPCTWGPFSP